MKKIIFLVLILCGVVIGQSKEDIYNNLQRGGAIDITDASPTSTYQVLVWDDTQGNLRLVTVNGLGNAYDSLKADYSQIDVLSLDSLVSIGQAAFTTTAQKDTIVISGAESTDMYFIQPISETLDAQDVQFQVVAKQDTLIVTRPASGASGLEYYWLRIKSH